MKRPLFTVDSYYHIYNRGVEKRNIFLDHQDYSRFLFGLYVFNNTEVVDNIHHKFHSDINEVEPRYPFVDIIAYCLISNHFHLFVRQKVENGIPKFMQKLGTGYTMYFNQKYNREGGLFQGKFKAVLTHKDNQLFYIPHYIHLNALDKSFPHWRTHGVHDLKKAEKVLTNYKWSSYPSYSGLYKISPLLFPDIHEFYPNAKEYKKSLFEWISRFSNEFLNEVEPR